jgi:VWFA-related protein
MRSIRLAAPALALACLAASAQTPETPTFPTQAEMVTVDVVVTDESGAPIRGLTREDFTIRDEADTQSLVLFEAIDSPAGPVRSAMHGSVSDNLAGGAVRPLIVIVFDEPHLTTANVELARDQFRKLPTQREMGVADVVLSSSTGGSWQLRLPEDAEDYAAVLARFRGLRPAVAPGRMTDFEAFQIAGRRNEMVTTQVYRRYTDLRLITDNTIVVEKGPKLPQNDLSGSRPSMGEGQVRTEAEERWQAVRKRQAATVAGLTRMLEGLQVRKGRKALMLVTEGFLQEGALPEYRQVSEAARRARASVNIVDPRDAGRLFDDQADTASSVEITDRIGLMARGMKATEGADALASATGGIILRNLPGLPAALHSVGTELRTYYLLGFEPKAAADGRFHKLTVETARKDVRISARPGYYAKGGADVAAAPPTLAQNTLDAPLDAPELPLRLAGYVLGPAKKGKTRVRLVAELDGSAFAGGRAMSSLDAVFQLAPRERPEAQQWATVIKKPSADKTVRVEAEFEADPGVYQARLMAREQGKGGREGSVRHTVAVPAEDAFRSTTPILTDLANGNVPVPRADRRFRRESKLYCMIEVMGAPASASVVAGVDLRQLDGNVRLRIPATPIASVPRSRMWAIPLVDLPPGPYELMISVQDVASNRTVAMQEGFEVVSND